MLISGLQKLTLLDYPGTLACTVFIGGCNFRCPFCHNASLVLPARMESGKNAGDILRFLKKRRELLDGVVITGGEPLLYPELLDFLQSIKDMGYKVKVDTNGSFPQRLRSIVKGGLVDYVAMDIKNAPLLYGRTIGLQHFDMDAVEQSKRYLLEDHVAYEFRTTVVRGLHTEESLLASARWIKGAKAYYLQQFCDSGDLIAPYMPEAFTDGQMRDLLQQVQAVIPSTQLRGVEG